jgi:hypothetical protein
MTKNRKFNHYASKIFGRMQSQYQTILNEPTVDPTNPLISSILEHLGLDDTDWPHERGLHATGPNPNHTLWANARSNHSYCVDGAKPQHEQRHEDPASDSGNHCSLQLARRVKITKLKPLIVTLGAASYAQDSARTSLPSASIANADIPGMQEQVLTEAFPLENSSDSSEARHRRRRAYPVQVFHMPEPVSRFDRQKPRRLIYPCTGEPLYQSSYSRLGYIQAPIYDVQLSRSKQQVPIHPMPHIRESPLAQTTHHKCDYIRIPRNDKHVSRFEEQELIRLLYRGNLESAENLTRSQPSHFDGRVVANNSALFPIQESPYSTWMNLGSAEENIACRYTTSPEEALSFGTTTTTDWSLKVRIHSWMIEQDSEGISHSPEEINNRHFQLPEDNAARYWKMAEDTLQPWDNLSCRGDEEYVWNFSTGLHQWRMAKIRMEEDAYLLQRNQTFPERTEEQARWLP